MELKKSKLLVFALLCLALVVGVFGQTTPKVKADGVQFIDTKPFVIANKGATEDSFIKNINLIATSSISYNNTTKQKNNTYFKFTLPIDSIVTLRYGNVDGEGYPEYAYDLYPRCTLFYNSEMSSVAFERVGLSKSETVDKRVFLKKGTYYLEVQACVYGSYLKDMSNKVSFAVGYTPCTNTTKFTVTKNITKTTTSNVKLTVKTYDPDAEIYVKEGVMDAKSPYWNINYLLDGNTYTVKTNGKYTVRIKDSLGNCSHKVIEVTNIDKKKPKTPVPTAYKKGTTKIVGNAEAGVLVYAKIGKKTYKAVTRDNGVFTISTPKLKKGTKIIMQAEDAVKHKSQTKTIKVK